MQLPKSIKFGHFDIKIKELEPELAASNNEEGSFHCNTRTIYIDKDIVDKGGADLICCLIHELFHASYYKNNLNHHSSEEDLVNSFSNDITELLSRTELLKIINNELRGKNGRPQK